jgi:hypothetical protein
VPLAATTTGVTAAAEDEVATALASMLGNFGQKFHTLSAQAQAFHREFVNLVDAGASAYISTEAINAEQTLLDAVNAPAQSLRGAAVAGPYETLVSNTVANLQALLPAFSIPGELAQNLTNLFPRAPSPPSCRRTSPTS